MHYELINNRLYSIMWATIKTAIVSNIMWNYKTTEEPEKNEFFAAYKYLTIKLDLFTSYSTVYADGNLLKTHSLLKLVS
jgi:hypothetical protein